MSLGNSATAVVIKHLTSGDNFWAKLQPVVKTPRNFLTIQHQVNAGGGRAQREELFVIFNVSKDRETLQRLISKNIQLVGSHLAQHAPVHESELKGILSIAKKSDRKIVDLGSGLILGQIDLVKTAFPDIFASQASKQQLNTHTGEDDTMSADGSSAAEITWTHLFEDVSSLIQHEPIRILNLSDLEVNPSINLGALALDVQNATPSARFDTSLRDFISLKQKLADRISKLQAGQYIRITFHGQEEDLFIGDKRGLIALKGLAEQQRVGKQSVKAASDELPVELPVQTPNQPEAQAEVIEQIIPSAAQQSIKEESAMNIERNIRWTIFYTKNGAIGKELEADSLSNQYGVIQYKDSEKGGLINLGVCVTADLCDRLHIPINNVAAKEFAASEIMSENMDARAALEKDQTIAILKFRKIHMIVYPMNKIPDALKNHIMSNPTSHRQEKLIESSLALNNHTLTT